MNTLFVLTGIITATGVLVWVFRGKKRSVGGLRVGRGSIMDAEPEGMSLFSADHVRMLSEEQLQAMERVEEDGR